MDLPPNKGDHGAMNFRILPPFKESEDIRRELREAREALQMSRESSTEAIRRLKEALDGTDKPTVNKE